MNPSTITIMIRNSNISRKFTLDIIRDNTRILFMVKCPECKKEFSNPKMEFRIGQEETGNQFQYAICSCPGCNVCLGIMKA